MTREQLIGLIAADSKFIDEREAITEYVRGLKAGEGLDEAAIRAGYQRFKDQKHAAEVAEKAQKHGLATAALQTFVDTVLSRMIFDGEQLGVRGQNARGCDETPHPTHSRPRPGSHSIRARPARCGQRIRADRLAMGVARAG